MQAIRTVEHAQDANRTDVLIIGAGFSGMTTAIEMIRKGNGRNFIIVEKGNQVGGTWNDSRYPGACCDVWSHLYSLSFEPNPNWTRLYPGQQEILQYMEDVAHKYKLYKHIKFNTSVEEARWDETTNTWKTKLVRQGCKEAEFGEEYTITSDFLVSAVGQLNTPSFPDIKGIDSFGGKSMHSARWDWEYDLRDKKIGIIGTGATNTQIIPELAKVCKSLTVFQRSPNWIIPRDDRPISTTMQAVFKYVPVIRKRYRAAMMDFRETFFDAIFDSKSQIHQEFTKMCNDHKAAQLPGEKYADLREKLQPHYALGCRRIVISDDYYPVFTLDHVNLETSPIREITEKGISVDGKEYDLDLIVYGTGFKTTQFMYPIKIYGQGGKTLEEVWEDGPSAYLGMTVPYMPNFSMLYGPNTNLGHNSIILMLEAQSIYINNLISKVLSSKARSIPLSIVPKPSVVASYNTNLQARLAQSCFADPSANSWYKLENGKITNNWADKVVPYQERTSMIDWDREYDITGLKEGGKEVEKGIKLGTSKWKRTVEETQVSNSTIIGGLVLAGVGAVVAGVLGKRRLLN